jgi:tRNA 2-thiouridine synthesizing protein B
MSALHTVNKSPLSSTALASCLAHVADDAAIILIEDGVYAALAAARPPAQLTAIAARGALHALGPDLMARGLATARLIEGIKVVDYEGFVDLTVAHAPVMAWL